MEKYRCFCDTCEGELRYNVKTIRRHYEQFNDSGNKQVRMRVLNLVEFFFVNFFYTLFIVGASIYGKSIS